MVENNHLAETITIQSENDAWEWLEKALSEKPLPEKLHIVFDGWPVWGIKINGNDWSSTVPTRIMPPLLEVQKDLNRSYVLLCYGTDSLKRLTNEDRDILELVVKVDKGSSDYKADLYTQLTIIAEKMVDKMSPEQLIVTMVGLALTFVSGSIIKHWISARQNEKQMQQTVELSKQETERIRIISRASEKEPILQRARTDVEDSHNRILKTIKPADSIQVAGIKMDAAEVAEIVQQDRARAEDLDIQGIFRVLANDTTQPEGYKIKVVRLNDGETFSVIVPSELPYEQQCLIRDAEWSKGAKLVHLSITASILHGKVRDAKIYSASSEPPQG